MNARLAPGREMKPEYAMRIIPNQLAAHQPTPEQRALTEAIADAQQRGADREVDALLMAKTILIRRETAAAHREPSGAQE